MTDRKLLASTSPKSERNRLKKLHSSLNKERDELIKINSYNKEHIERFRDLLNRYDKCYTEYKKYPESCWDNCTNKKIRMLLDRSFCRDILNLRERRNRYHQK